MIYYKIVYATIYGRQRIHFTLRGTRAIYIKFYTHGRLSSRDPKIKN